MGLYTINRGGGGGGGVQRRVTIPYPGHEMAPGVLVRPLRENTLGQVSAAAKARNEGIPMIAITISRFCCGEKTGRPKDPMYATAVCACVQ